MPFNEEGFLSSDSGQLVNSLSGDYLVGRVGQLEPHLVWTKCDAD
jgi:hypothetical protein